MKLLETIHVEIPDGTPESESVGLKNEALREAMNRSGMPRHQLCYVPGDKQRKDEATVYEYELHLFECDDTALAAKVREHMGYIKQFGRNPDRIYFLEAAKSTLHEIISLAAVRERHRE